MKVAILGVRGIPSSYSGFETFVQELAPRLVEGGHDVTVYCRSSLFAEKIPSFKGVRLVYLPSLEHKLLSTVSHSTLAMARACLSRVDVILVVNAVNGWLGLISRVARKNAAINVDGMEWERPKWNGLAKLVFRLSAQLGTKVFDAVVTDADAMAEVYANKFHASCSVIPYGGDSSWSIDNQEQQVASIATYGLEPDAYYLVVGRRIPDNNGDLLVAGFVASSSSRRLVIVGGADYRGNAAEQTFYERMRRAADDRVLFLGQVDDQTSLEALWAGCFAYLHGHGYGGTNPSLLRALNRGCCVLALDTPFNREVLDDGTFGVLFRRDPLVLSAAINELEGNHNLRSTLRVRAPKRIREKYSWAEVTRMYEDLFKAMQRGRS